MYSKIYNNPSLNLLTLSDSLNHISHIVGAKSVRTGSKSVSKGTVGANTGSK